MGLYSDESHFRSHVNMARHGFGKGEYRYFRYPLPDLLDTLRTTLYPRLAAVANEWNGRMGVDERYPDDHASILLSEPGIDFTGGEFVLTEQRPRMQSGVEVVPLRQGRVPLLQIPASGPFRRLASRALSASRRCR